MKHGKEWYLEDKSKFTKTQMNHFYSYPPYLFEALENNKENVKYIYSSHKKVISYGVWVEYTEDDIDYTKYSPDDKYVAFDRVVRNIFSFNSDISLTTYLWSAIELYIGDSTAVDAVNSFMNWCQYKKYV